MAPKEVRITGREQTGFKVPAAAALRLDAGKHTTHTSTLFRLALVVASVSHFAYGPRTRLVSTPMSAVKTVSHRKTLP